MKLCVARDLYTVLLYRFFLIQIDVINWVAVLAILNLYGDVIYNKALILVLCVVYWLLFVCFYGK